MTKASEIANKYASQLLGRPKMSADHHDGSANPISIDEAHGINSLDEAYLQRLERKEHLTERFLRFV